MIVFDQLKKNDPQLRAVTLAVLGGLAILLAGLWWVQVVSARDYQESLETQSFRSVRIPAVRGSILDCNHKVLAENRPTYNVSLYLEELRAPFDNAYSNALRQARAEEAQEAAETEHKLGRSLTRLERKHFVLNTVQRNLLRESARSQIASNVILQVSQRLEQPLAIDVTNFERHYETRLALPYPVLENLDPTNIARFEEQSTSPIGVDIDVQSTRVYPYQTTAAHLLGSLKRNNDSVEGEEASFSYRLPDFRGDLGIEYGFDKELRGTAGAKSVLVNNLGYRQTETVWNPAEAGHNVVLTIDLRIQQVAENALRNVQGPATRGAVVVMDVRTGDVLAMASSPTLNPNLFVQPRIPPEEWSRINDLQAQKNRATQENYAPGSIFKIVVGLAALEAGLNPHEVYRVQPNPEMPNFGAIFVHGHKIKDTAHPGDYDFRRALMRSSNSYFITNGLRIGPERIIRMGRKFHLGERIGLPLRQETAGYFPKQIDPDWTDGKTANLSIGQDPVLVTPLQVAVLASAIANGGKVLWPRLVERIETQDPTVGEQPVVFTNGLVRDELGVSQRSLRILQEAMLADTEDPEGTGKHAAVPGLRICGKTGTAQIQDLRNIKTGQTTWFASFAPYESPRWAVVVMVEDGTSGGDTCSPVARPIYMALLERDRPRPAKGETMAKAN
jgi:penicillin-binding protein 2